MTSVSNQVFYDVSLTDTQNTANTQGFVDVSLTDTQNTANTKSYSINDTSILNKISRSIKGIIAAIANFFYTLFTPSIKKTIIPEGTTPQETITRLVQDPLDKLMAEPSTHPKKD